MHKNSLDLSIVIVNYNTEKLTIDCIKSIYSKIKSVSFEVIVVDNASVDNSVPSLEKIQKRYKNFKLIKSKTNLGFAKGNNEGMKISKGEFVLLLNSDTKIVEDFFSKIIERMNKDKNIGISSCALKFPNNEIQASGGYFPNLRRVFYWMFFVDDIPFFNFFIKSFHPMHEKFFVKNKSFYLKEKQQDWVTGAFFLIKREVLDEIGLIDEEYFMYTEETDFCFRAKKKGFITCYYPKWSIIHYGGASSKTREFPILQEYKNIVLFFKKNYPAWQLPYLKLLLKSGALLRMIIFGILEGKDTIKIYAKAFNNI